MVAHTHVHCGRYTCPIGGREEGIPPVLYVPLLIGLGDADFVHVYVSKIHVAKSDIRVFAKCNVYASLFRRISCTLSDWPKSV